MKVGFAQLNPTVGDLRGNFEKILQFYERLATAGAELIVTPELAITGYPPQDLVFKARFVPETLEIVEELHRRVGEAALLVGFVDRNEGRGRPFHNAAALLVRGEPIRKAHKSLLPTYDVFDEDRYFQPAARVQPFDLNGKKIGVTICEDIWTEHYLPRPLYDCEPTRGLIAQLPAFREHEQIVDTESTAAVEFREESTPEQLFAALSLGLRDYLRKCNFKSAVLGLSGGADSAVVAVIGVEALGAENVVGVSMPSQYSSRGSIDDAKKLAENLGIKLLHVPIAETFAVFKSQLKEIFSGLPENETEENMQPRLRAMTLMALSNKFGHLVLSTGNKSELSVGYCTIYGDMAGGLAVISDVPKTMIYELARWINRQKEIMPASTIEKPPSAELKPNQKDQDTLPPYEKLDEILRLYVEDNLSARDIIGRGFDEKTVRWVQRRVDLNEYKREQAAPGLKVTSRAFGRGLRMPIAQKYVD